MNRDALHSVMHCVSVSDASPAHLPEKREAVLDLLNTLIEERGKKERPSTKGPKGGRSYTEYERFVHWVGTNGWILALDQPVGDKFVDTLKEMEAAGDIKLV